MISAGTRMENHRPSPDELLARAKEEEERAGRGRLKLFFGFAPGVGKTHSMLEAARAKKAEGLDVVAGAAETHGRAETERLLEGLEVLRRKQIAYRGVVLREFDLDAALKRHPAVMLVDELAHTNAPDCRHPKRWQDVEELLQAGIDVYSTLNVQHLESLNDVVAQITGVTVRETVPDSVLDQADELELVDLPPEELLKRLREGKVYVPDQAARAIERFFRKGNLIALRELSLRQVADRVAGQMHVYRREQAIRQTWPAAERLLVGVSPSPFSVRLVRAARRMAESLHAEWFVLYVETPAFANLPQEAQDRVAGTLRLAAQLGGQTAKVSGTKARDEILTFAREHNVTKILVGKPLRRRLRDVVFGSVVDELVWNCGDIDIYVITGEGAKAQPVARRPRALQLPKRDYLLAVAAVAACTALSALVHTHLELTNLVMVYLLGVVAVASLLGRGPAILASILSVGLFDYLFVPPHFTFAVADSQYAVTLGVMLLVAVLVSSLTVRVRQQAENARKQERRTRALYEMSRGLAASHTLDEALDTAVERMNRVFEGQVTVFLPNRDGALEFRAGDRSAEREQRELGVATWVFEHGKEAGLGTDTLPGARGIYLPLRASQRVLGVVRLEPAIAPSVLEPERLGFLEAFTSQIALGIERESLSQEARAAQVEIEAERMRNALLSSVSHDLRIPLTVIAGSASALVENEKALTESSKRELAETVLEESRRLDRLVQNLLEMSRLQSGEARLNKEWQVLEEVVGTSLAQLEVQLRGRTVAVSLPQDLPLVFLDALLLERVFTNLLDNAAKYTPAGTPMEISARIEGKELVVEIADRGPGLQEGGEERLFEKFYQAAPGQTRGVGLGLSICRAIVQAHGGRIWARNRAGGGAVFGFSLPMREETPGISISDRESMERP